MADRNKTELTQNITRLAALWLDEHGFKPVETEVRVDKAWVADIAGVCFPTQTELIALKLLRRGPSYNGDWKNPDARIRHNELVRQWREEREKLPERLTALVEVKTSLGDYRGDPKWERPWPTNLCYVALPAGMVDSVTLPKDWGVMVFSQDGSSIRRVFSSGLRPMTTEQHLDVIVSVAVARDHVTRYDRLRQFQKEVRLNNVERESISRVQDAVIFVKRILDGKSVEEARSYCRLKAKLPALISRELEELRVRVMAPKSADAVIGVQEPSTLNQRSSTNS